MSDIHTMPISKVTVADIQDIINKAAEDGFAEKTLKEYKSVFSQICQYAIINRVMDFNPAQGIVIPRVEAPEVRRALTQKEQSWILAETDHRAHVGAMIMMLAGLRRGELLALTWQDINLHDKTINVCKSMAMVDCKPIVKNSTKTASGMRIVDIPTILVDFLTMEKKKANTMLVVPDANGNLASSYVWRDMWDSYLKELNFKFGNFDNTYVTDDNGNLTKFVKSSSRFAPKKIPMVIPHFTAHWLRHTFITSMYLAGVDVLTASKQAGHADIKTTMDIYTHLDAQYKRKQMSKLDEYYAKMG